MEELRPDLLPVSSTTTTTTLASDTIPATTTTTSAPSQVGGGGGGGTVVNSGLSVISTAVRAQQTQDLVRLPPPPSKGAVPAGVPVGMTLALQWGQPPRPLRHASTVLSRTHTHVGS